MRHISSAILIAAAYGCSNPSQTTQQPQQPAASAAVHYQVTRLPTIPGGSQSRGMAINRQGWGAGWSNQAEGTRRAVLWKNGVLTNLNTLGGPSSMVLWPGLNDEGAVVGISQTGESDPLHEDWSCELGGFLLETTDLICRGFVWQNGTLRELPALGGNQTTASEPESTIAAR